MIYLHQPTIGKKEQIILSKCIKSGWISTGGKYYLEFQKLINKKINSKYSLPLSSGTDALFLALKTLKIEEKSEIIVPTITFIATVNVIKYNNCQPIFMDVDKHCNLDQEKTIEFLSKHTFFKQGFSYNKLTKKKISALIVVHTFGNLANFLKLKKICRKKNIKIIEDAAEALGVKHKKKKIFAGTIGDAGVFSFNGNKIISTGGGGCVVLKNLANYKYAKYLSLQAKDDGIYFKHNEVGYNFALSNISSAIGVSQIKNLNSFINKKKKIYLFYKNSFANTDYKIVEIPKFSESNYWLIILDISNSRYRNKINLLIKKLYKNNIQARPIWYPNHLQKQYQKNQKFKITNATEIVSNYLSLPSSSHLQKKQLKKIIKVINE